MRHPDAGRERGVTMVELIIGMSIGTMVVLLATYLLINTIQTQSTVTISTEASTRGQAISATIDRAVRNASEFTVVTGSLLVCTGDRWERFWFDPGPGTLRHATSDGTASVLADSVSDGSFAKIGPRLDYDFTIGAGAGPRPVVIESSVSQRNPEGSAPCPS